MFRPSVIHGLCGLCGRAGDPITSHVIIHFIMDCVSVPLEPVVHFAVGSCD